MTAPPRNTRPHEEQMTHLADALTRIAAAWPGLLALARHPGAGHSADTVWGSPANANLSAVDLLHHPDHNGHPGLITLVCTSEAAVRAALGHSAPATSGDTRVPDALHYLAIHTPTLTLWTPTAAGIIWNLWDETLSSIDTARVRLDYDLARRPWQRLANWANTVLDHPDTTPQEHAQAVVDQEAAGKALAECGEYIDWEGRHYDQITARYDAARRGAEGFLAWLAGELDHALSAARGLLGVAGHSIRPVVPCPSCNGPVGLSRDDPGTTECGGCGRRLRLASGEAADWFASARADGWTPSWWQQAG